MDVLCERAESGLIQITPARRKILEALINLKSPFTAGCLEAEVMRRSPEIGRATVFRMVKLLRQAGILSQVRLSEGQDGYIICPASHHHHLICNSCGAIEELFGCDLRLTFDSILKDRGFHHMSHVFDIYGLCAKCADKQNLCK